MGLEKILNNFKSKKILVIGDAIIDSYLWGEINRMSPEAPVPVVDVKVNQNDNRLGGAANVALNLKELGAKAILCTVIGNDSKGILFEQLMKEQGLGVEGMLISDGRKTTTKTRVIVKDRHQLRIDEEDKHPIKIEKQFLNLVIKVSKIIDAIILQDYNKGVLTKNIITKLINYANENNIPTIVDPKKDNFLSYKNCTLFKPNLHEISEGLQQEINPENLKEIREITSKLKRKLKSNSILLTLSDKGICINSEKHFYHFKSKTNNVIDVSGAGDTVVSIAALCLACKTSAGQLAQLSNIAGGIVCEKVGVVPINFQQLYKRAKLITND
jgi:rfaE bifunctional protein kinase chain/domain